MGFVNHRGSYGHPLSGFIVYSDKYGYLIDIDPKRGVINTNNCMDAVRYRKYSTAKELITDFQLDSYIIKTIVVKSPFGVVMAKAEEKGDLDGR